MWSLAAPDQLNGASAVLVVAPDPERQASLAELLGSEEYFRVLVEESHDIIVVMNREGTVLYTSPSVHRILGWEPAALIGRRLLSFVHRADARPTTRLLARMLDDPASVAAARCRIRNPAGEWRVIEFTGRDVLETPPVGRIVINAREVTAQHAAETAVRRSEERYRHMVEGSDHIFFYSRTPDGFVYLSPSITAVLGYDPAELIRSTPDWIPRPSVTPHGGSAEPDPSTRLVEARTRTGEPVTLELVEGDPTAGDARAEVHGFARDVTERERLQTALRNAAFQDSLTGLPNRALFTDRLTRAILRRQRNPDSAFALLFLDLDRFKVINDSLGHGVGDRLLLAVADRLRLHLRPEDAFARFGGDEFAILLEDLPGPVDGSRVARRIVDVLAEPFEIDGFEVCTTASIGIVLGSDTGSCAESLLRNADMAMYRAKAAGGDTFELYDQPMHLAAVRRLELETELRRALDRDELQLHFQPIVRLCDSSIAGVEGLMRWVHPSKGIVAPGDFIGVAEETGYITAIGEWVLETAVAHLVEWQKNADAPDFFVSVNLSARQLHDSSLLRRVRSLLRESGIRPETLKLEITEATLLENTDRAARALRDLDALGIQIFLDDFGTGAASLNYLHRLPLHGLKIDPSFIARMHTDPRYAVLVESTVTIAKGLGLVVVAEGIEEAAQADALIGLCCDYAQGFHFAHPTPAEDLPAVIRAFGTSLEVG